MASERQSLTQDAALGVVSKSTLATKLGYDWEAEQEHMAAETVDTDGAAMPSKEEADAMAAIFKAIKDGVDAGIDLEVVLKVSGLFTDAQIRAIVQNNEAEEEADALEARERMEAMREGGLIGQQQPGQPGQPSQAPPGAFGRPPDGG
jgi:hypothetical protein